MRSVLARRFDAYLLVLGIVGVNGAVVLAVALPEDAGTGVSWSAIGAAALAVVAIGALWVVFDSISIAMRKFGDRSMSRTQANLRAVVAFLVPATYRQAAILIGVPAVVVFVVVGAALATGVGFVLQA